MFLPDQNQAARRQKPEVVFSAAEFIDGTSGFAASEPSEQSVEPLVRTGQGAYRRDYTPSSQRPPYVLWCIEGAIGGGIGALIALNPAMGITLAVGMGIGLLLAIFL